MNKRVIISQLLIAFFSASILISAAQASPDYSLEDKQRPSWILSPERIGFLSVVGYAPKQLQSGMESQRRVALLNARQQLGQIVQVRVENTFQHEHLVTKGMASQSAVSNTRISSSAVLNLNHAEVSAQWVDPENGSLYLLLELPAN